MEPSILFFDDREDRYNELIKNVPAGAVFWAKTPEEAISVLENYHDQISLWLLDHDMQFSDTEADGTDFVFWVMQNSFVLDNQPKILIHSANPVAARVMHDLLRTSHPEADISQAMYAWLALRHEDNIVRVGEDKIYIDI